MKNRKKPVTVQTSVPAVVVAVPTATADAATAKRVPVAASVPVAVVAMPTATADAATTKNAPVAASVPVVAVAMPIATADAAMAKNAAAGVALRSRAKLQERSSWLQLPPRRRYWFTAH